MLPLLSHALQKHGEACKAWEYFQATSAEHGIIMETIGHRHLIILNSMEKHGKHGALFSHDFRQHGEHGNSLFSSVQIAWKSMGSKVLHFL